MLWAGGARVQAETETQTEETQTETETETETGDGRQETIDRMLFPSEELYVLSLRVNRYRLSRGKDRERQIQRQRQRPIGA